MSRGLFSPRSLASLIRAGDSQQFDLDLKGDRLAIIEGASASAISGQVDLTAYSTTSVKGKPCISYQSYEAHLVLRAISRHLRRRLRISLPSRDRIVNGVVQTLMDGTPMYAIRRDITSFYESVPLAPLRERLLFDTASSSLVRDYLRAYFSIHCPDHVACGLPRGVGLSALLAEIAMREFDSHVRAIGGVYKYYRFSDDILLFSTKPESEMAGALASALPGGMVYNIKKSDEAYFPGKAKNAPVPEPLEYLGYRFTTEQPRHKDHSRIVRVAIAEKKITKIKTRLALSFKAFGRDGNGMLLQDRCRFLACNYRVRQGGADALKAGAYVYSGVFYNYKMCGRYSAREAKVSVEQYDCNELKALDSYYHALINRNLANPALTGARASRLRRYSFHKGYVLRIKGRFTGERVSILKRAWRND